MIRITAWKKAEARLNALLIKSRPVYVAMALGLTGIIILNTTEAHRLGMWLTLGPVASLFGVVAVSLGLQAMIATAERKWFTGLWLLVSSVVAGLASVSGIMGAATIPPP